MRNLILRTFTHTKRNKTKKTKQTKIHSLSFSFSNAAPRPRRHRRHVDVPRRVTPLVLVPSINFHEPLVDDLRAGGVDDGRTVVVDKVGRDERPFFEPQDSSERGSGCFLECGIDLLDGDVLFDLKHRIGDRSIQQGNADGEAVEFPRELREDERNRLRGARRGRRQVDERRARPAEVRFFGVEGVDDGLRVGDVVDRRDAAVVVRWIWWCQGGKR